MSVSGKSAAHAKASSEISTAAAEGPASRVADGEHVTNDQALGTGECTEIIGERSRIGEPKSVQVTRQVTVSPKSPPPARRSATAARPPTSRSAVTNGSRMLVGVNGGSALARRYRDLVEGLTAEVGADLGEADRLTIRNAASLQLHVEDLTSRMARGEAVDAEAFTRAANAASRAIAALRKRKPARRARPALADYLHQKRGGDPC